MKASGFGCLVSYRKKITKLYMMPKRFKFSHVFQPTQRGFTLIELLVVMGIIAGLASVVLIAINPSRQFAQTRNTQRIANINAILNAIGQYIADNQGRLPAGIDLDPATVQPLATSAANLCEDLVPTFIPALPRDPSVPDPSPITICATAYDTAYTVNQDSSGRLTITAPNAELGITISVTR